MVSCKSIGSRPLPAASATVWGAHTSCWGQLFKLFKLFKPCKLFFKLLDRTCCSLSPSSSILPPSSKNSSFFFVKVKKIAGSLWPLVSSSSSQYPSLHCNIYLGAVPSKTRMYQKKYMASESGHKLQGVSKKRYLSDFLSYFKITKNNQK